MILIRLITSCAPTNNVSQAVKDQFYAERLKKVLGKNRPQREQTILMGDMNAKIANYNIGYEGAMGAHG